MMKLDPITVRSPWHDIRLTDAQAMEMMREHPQFAIATFRSGRRVLTTMTDQRSRGRLREQVGLDHGPVVAVIRARS